MSILLDTGAAYIASLLRGNISQIPNCMYLEYCNGDPDAPVLEASRDLDYYRDLSGNYWFVRIPLVHTGVDSTGKKITFSGILPSTGSYEAPGAQGVLNPVGPTSKFYAATLVCAPDMDDMTKDIPLMVRNFMVGDVFTPLPVVSGACLTAPINFQIGGAE